MRKSFATVMTLAAVLLAVAIPVVLAIYLADRQARRAELGLVTAYARDVLHRSEATSDQIFLATNTLEQARSTDPCSDSNIAIMRKFDLSSSYLQAVGYVVDGHLLCSSQGRDAEGLALGPVDWVTPVGVRIRINVKFPFDRETTYLVAETRDGYAAIVNKALPLDATTSEKDASLATFATFNGRVMATRGYVNPKWMVPTGPKLPLQPGISSFVDDSYVVAVVVSNRYYVGAIAALPLAYVQAQTRAVAMIGVPVGLLAGIALAIVAVYLGRLQLAMPAVIKAALKRNEFVLHYQPIVNLGTGQWVGAEALIRWRRGNGEVIRPDLFIPVAEDAGMIQLITRRVTELAARDIGDLFIRYPDFHIAMNLSSVDLESESTVGLLRRLSEDTHAAAGNLLVEVTERAFMNREPAGKIIRELRASGIRVAVDDFGTGYSSLAFLESFELDFLKIDKSFVDTMNLNASTSQVALHIIEMAKSLKLEMVAEGVETQAQAQFLRERGVHYAQGWLFGKPMRMSELVFRLAQSRQTTGWERLNLKFNKS